MTAHAGHRLIDLAFSLPVAIAAIILIWAAWRNRAD